MAAFTGLLSGLFGRRAAPTASAAYSAGSHIGSRRNNQDNLRAGSAIPCIRSCRSFSREGVIQIRDLELFCVCDGVGGGYRGELAAKYALKAIHRFMRSEEPCGLSLRDALIRAAEWAQTEVCEFYRTVQAEGGCTLVMAAVRGDAYAFLNIGDSPGFLLPADGGIIELSRRHNMAWEKLRTDQIPAPSDRNHLLRYLGMAGTSAEAMAHITEGRLQEGDCLLLCSDGVTNAYLPPSLAEAIRRGTAAAEITAAAARAEKADNCTAVCLTIRQLFPQPEAEPTCTSEPSGPDRTDCASPGRDGG